MSGIHFSLADIDEEVITLDSKQALPEPPKGRTPNLRSRSGKKRKSQDPSEIPEIPQEISKAIEVITANFREKSELVQEMQETIDRQTAELVRERSEIARIKKENRELKVSLEKKDLEVTNRIQEESEILKADIKNEARAVVFEARIKMASDVAAKGFDSSFWPVESWKKSLAFLRRIDPAAGSSLNEGGDKIPKPSSKKTTKDLPVPAEEKAQANDAVYEGLGPIENLAMAAEMADTTPGDEGQ